MTGCNSSSNEDSKEINEDILKDPSSSLNTTLDGKFFSIPSPVLTALLIKKTSPTFYAEFLNPIENIDKYNSESIRALNLGIYGADLGYASLYNQKSQILNYLSNVEKLTNILGLESAFDKSFVDRYNSNVNNEDSLVVIISQAFMKGDIYLKNGNRKAVSILILTGGWIESMHLATQISNKNKNAELISRIGEQKQTLVTIIDVLKEYNKMNTNDKLIAQFEDLLTSFEKVKINYTYAEPVADEKSKTTTLKHTVSYEISGDLLKEVTTKLSQIRTSIIS